MSKLLTGMAILCAGLLLVFSAVFTSSISFRSPVSRSSAASFSSVIAQAIPSSQNAASDSRSTEIQLEGVHTAGYSFTALESETPPLIPRRLLFGNPVKARPRLSLDGTKLAYLAPDKENVLNVWIRDLKDPQIPDRQITSDHNRGIIYYAWDYDSNSIIYAQDKNGDENNHIYQTNVSSLETQDLTPFEKVKAQVLEYDHKFPDEMLVLLNKRDPAEFDVYRLSLKTGALTLDTQNPGGVFNWVSDHQLNVRVSESYDEEGNKLIRVRNSRDDPWRDFMRIDQNEVGEGVLGFTADDQSLYLSTSLDGNTARLMQLNLATGEKQLIIQDPEYDLDEVMVNPMTYQLEAVGFERERYHWVLLDQSLVPDFTFLSEHLKRPFLISSRDLKNQIWVIARLSDTHPVDFYLYHRQNKTVSFLFSSEPDLEKYKLDSMTPITFPARDGMILHGYLSLPAVFTPSSTASLPLRHDNEKIPLIIFVHGGPSARDSWGLNPTVQWLTNRGYGVLQINYRGSSGYGKRYLNAGNREWGAKMQTDLLDGKQWAVDQGIADASKVAIYGGSYGGYATLVGLAFTPDEYCCGIDVVGPSNLITLLKTSPPYWKVFKSQMDRQIGDIDKDRDLIISRSPLYKADQIKKPLLIAQGANDPRVNQAESDQIVEAMRKKGLPVEYLLFPDEGHGFAKPQNRLKFYAAAEAFLARYLGGRDEPPSPEEDWKALEK